MHIVIDSSVVVAEGFGSSTRLRVLLSVASALGYKIYVPRLVPEEVAAEFSRELVRETQDVGNKLARVSRLLERDLNSPIDGLHLDEEAALFRTKLLAQLSEANVTMLDYPQNPHEDMVKRATQRRRPFDQKGSGYRDTLIWLSVLDLAAKVDGQVILVSADGDFRDAQGNLHGDLVQDAVGLGLPSDKVTLIVSMLDLIDKHVRPNLGKVFWESPLETLAELGIDAKESITLGLLSFYSGKEWDPNELDLPNEYESPVLGYVDEVSNLSVVDVRKVTPDRFLVKIEASLVGDFDVFMYKPDWYIMDDPRLITIDSEWNDHYVLAAISLPLHCEVDLILDASDPNKHEVQVVSVSPYTEDL